MSLQVCEFFYSIQGESTCAGRPCIFIRLAGCNLHCAYCDTTYSHGEGEAAAIDEILTRIERYPCRLVEVTGGEPLAQPETPQLLQALLEREYTVLLETNGSMPLDAVDHRCVKIVDVKCPSSGEQGSLHESVIESLFSHDELKFVIGNRRDYEFARDFLPRITRPVAAIHFSPIMETLAAADLAAWILADGLSVRLSTQLHKYIWPHIERGV